MNTFIYFLNQLLDQAVYSFETNDIKEFLLLIFGFLLLVSFALKITLMAIRLLKIILQSLNLKYKGRRS